MFGANTCISSRVTALVVAVWGCFREHKCSFFEHVTWKLGSRITPIVAHLPSPFPRTGAQLAEVNPLRREQR